MNHGHFLPSLLLLLALFLMCAFPGESASAEPPQTIRVVLDNNYPPFVFLDNEGRVQGIVVDQWRLWSQKTGVNAEIHALDWNEALRRMRAGEFDVIDTLFHTDARAELFDYLPAYQKIEVPIFFDGEVSGIVDAASLTGFAVGVKSGDAAIDYLQKRGITSLVHYTSYESLVQAARDRKITTFVIDAPPALYFLHKYGVQNRFRHTEPLYVGEFHRAVLKGNHAVLNRVAEGFAAISPSEYLHIERKWYGRPATEPLPVRQIVGVLAVTGLLVVGLFLWNQSLRRAVTQRTVAFKKSEERSRAIVEALPDMLFRFDQNGTFLDCHVADRESLLLPPEQFLGRTIHDLLPPELAAQTERHLKRALATGEMQHYEYHLLLKGIPRHYEARMVVSGEGEVLSIVRDVTERKRIEQALLESEAKYRQLFDAESDAVFLIDSATGSILEANAAAEGLYGYSREELLTMKNTDLSAQPGETRRQTEQAPHIAGQPIMILLRYHRKKDGAIFPVEVAARAFFLQERSVHIAAIRDISERKRLEEHLLQSQKMEAVGVLAGGVAHDFNNMLQAIIGNVHLLQLHSADNPVALKFTGHIQELARRGANLTQGLLAFSRKQIFSPRILDLNELVPETVKIYARLIGEEIELALSLSDGALTIYGDESQLQQVLLNLLTNARDAMPVGGTCCIRTLCGDCAFPNADGHQTVQPCAVLEVTDSGMGIADKDLPHIFEPFYTTKEVGKGTGLGLSVVYGIVRQHGGTISVSTEPAQGTSFRISFPLGYGVVGQRTPHDHEHLSGKGETILLVEDDADVRISTAQLLEQRGYRVIMAAGGKEALAAMQEQNKEISLGLIDAIMPRMNGAEVLTALRDLQPGLKAIFISGYPQEVLKGRSGCNVPFVAKPIMPSALFSTIREVLDS